MKEQVVTDARRVLKEEKETKGVLTFALLLLVTYLFLDIHFLDSSGLLPGCSKENAQRCYRFAWSAKPEDKRVMQSSLIRDRMRTSNKYLLKEETHLATGWCQFQGCIHLAYRSVVQLKANQEIPRMSHTTDRSAIAKGEAVGLKDSELAEARRVLEEEKVRHTKNLFSFTFHFVISRKEKTCLFFSLLFNTVKD